MESEIGADKVHRSDSSMSSTVCHIFRPRSLLISIRFFPIAFRLDRGEVRIYVKES